MNIIKRLSLLSLLIAMLGFSQIAQASALTITAQDQDQTITNGNTSQIVYHYILHNNLSVPLYLDSEDWSNTSDDMSATPVVGGDGICSFGENGTPLAANGQSGDSCALVFYFTPRSYTDIPTAKSFSSTITVKDAVPETLKSTAQLTVNPRPGTLTLSSSAVATTDDQTGSVTLTNNGDATVTSLSVTIPSSISSYVSDNCGSSLAKGVSCTIAYDTSGLTSSIGSTTIAIAGTTLESSVSSNLTFEATVGDGHLVFEDSSDNEITSARLVASDDSHLVLKNTGDHTINNLTLSIPANLQGYITSSCGTSLAADASCELSYDLPDTISNPLVNAISANGTNVDNGPVQLPVEIADKLHTMNGSGGGRIVSYTKNGNDLYTASSTLVYKENGNTWEKFGTSSSSIGIIKSITTIDGSVYATAYQNIMKLDSSSNTTVATVDATFFNSMIKFNNKLYIATGGNGVYVANDTLPNTLSLSALNAGLTGGSAEYAWQFEVFDSKLYLSTSSGVYCLNDAGNSWEKISNTTMAASADAMTVFDNKLTVSADKGVYAYNGGTTWTKLGSDLPERVLSLAVYNGELIAGTVVRNTNSPAAVFTGGLFTYNSGNNAWEQNVTPYQYGSINALYPDGGTLNIGDKVYGNHVYTNTGFSDDNQGIHFNYVINTINKINNRWYYGFNTAFDSSGAIMRLSTNNTDWQSLEKAQNAQITGGVKNLIMDPDNPNALYYNIRERLYLYNTTAESLQANLASNSGSINDMTLVNLGGQCFIFAASSNGVHAYNINTDTWTDKSEGLGDVNVWYIYDDSNVSPNVIYVGTSFSGIYRSIDDGESWSAFNAGIENETVFQIIKHDGTLYAASGAGVFVYSPTSSEWERISGLTGSINQITFDGDVLYAATNSGLYRYQNSQWLKISSNTVNQSYYSVAINSDDTVHKLYAGSDELGLVQMNLPATSNQAK